MGEFQRLLEQHYRPLERFVRFRMEGTGEAEDILQEVLITACQRFEHLRDHEKFKPWILAIAQNKCRDYYRRKQPQQVPIEDVEPIWMISKGNLVQSLMARGESGDRGWFHSMSITIIDKLVHSFR